MLQSMGSQNVGHDLMTELMVDLQYCDSSCIEQSESVIYIHISILSKILFPHRSL